MQAWLNFFLCIFWISLISFLINPTNFIFLLIFSEIVWIVLYCYTILTGVINDDLTLLTNSFLIIGLASLEFVLGYLLIILFKYFNKTTNLIDNSKLNKNYFYKNTQKIYTLNINWNNKIKN